MSERVDASPMLSRYLVQGVSGSGKSTFATALAAALDAPYLELDSLFHQPGWTPLELEEFRTSVRRVVEEDRWVVDGNYSQVRDLVWDRADVVIFLDLSRSLVMQRVIRRTLSRLLRRQVLWHGNRESWRNLFSGDPSINIILWSWTTHAKYHRLVPAEARAQCDHAEVVVLRRPRDVRAFLNSRNGAP